MRDKIIAVILAIFALSSCQKTFNVSSVRFSKDGGTQIIEVNGYDLWIYDRNGEYESVDEYDETTGVYRTTVGWLCVEKTISDSQVTVTATRNDSGKRRTLYLEAMNANVSTSIPVIQER